MRIYLDACALNRLFDDKSQRRIRLESEAVEQFFVLLHEGRVEWLSSEVLDAEIINNPNPLLRSEALRLILLSTARIILHEIAFRRADDLEQLGYGAYDALHLASAEQARVDFLLTTDDRFLNRVRRGLGTPSVKVQNPLNWVRESKA